MEPRLNILILLKCQKKVNNNNQNNNHNHNGAKGKKFFEPVTFES